jgi:pimeloyl-ACP methyl ester carboxylesterase
MLQESRTKYGEVMIKPLQFPALLFTEGTCRYGFSNWILVEHDSRAWSIDAVSRLNYAVGHDHYMQPTKAYLSIRRSRIFYETSGEGEPLLLLHGGFGTVGDFASQTPELAKHFKVVAYERPGHGHTADNDEPFSYVTMSEYTADLIEALKLGPANVVGWSDGAIISLLLAISRLDLVKRVICVSGNFNTSSLTPQALDWITSATPESFRKDQPTLARQYDAVSPDGAAHFSTVFEKTKTMWLNEPNIRKEELARISAPTLVMAADRDGITAEHTLELFRSIKGAELCIVPGATHFLLSEKPDATNSAILDFLLADGKARR